MGWLSATSDGFTIRSWSCIQLESPLAGSFQDGLTDIWANGASSWPGHFSSPAHGLSSSSRLTFLHGGLRAEFQKGKGRSCKALWRTVSTTQNSYTVAPTTFYKSKQLTVQPRLKRWGNRLHLLTEGTTKKLWQYSISHRKFLACICINGRYKGALSIAAPRGTQHIIRNLSLHS